MAYELQQAKELVVEAGKKLVESGLIARTWGNVSARISDKQFVITPSGRPYNTLTPDEIVVVNIDDCSYEGNIKPSSEKGIHADAYKLRSDVNFVIHTHQVKASVISTAGISIDNVPEKYIPIIGNYVPCADYGMPSTDKLRKGVEAAVKNHPRSKAIIMKHHGALCVAADSGEAFEIASALEEVCENVIENNYIKRANAKAFNADAMRNHYLFLQDTSLKMPSDIIDLGCSVRIGNYFYLTLKDGSRYNIHVDSCVSNDGLVPKVARIHSAIYKTSKVNNIAHLTDPDVVAVSAVGKSINPLLDDLAQIAGPTIKIAEWNQFERDSSANEIKKCLKGRNAILIKNCGAICTGNNEDDLNAVDLVMAKGCESEIGSKLLSTSKSSGISYLDSFIMRTIYVQKYMKQASK